MSAMQDPDFTVSWIQSVQVLSFQIGLVVCLYGLGINAAWCLAKSGSSASGIAAACIVLICSCGAGADLNHQVLSTPPPIRNNTIPIHPEYKAAPQSLFKGMDVSKSLFVAWVIQLIITNINSPDKMKTNPAAALIRIFWANMVMATM